MTTTPRATRPDTPHAHDELLTMKEVADIIRVPLTTLRYWRTDVHHWLEDQSSHPHGTR